jgi:hypothetical protein
MITKGSILYKNEKILANELGRETVMMSIERARYYGMNKTGSYIWKLLETPLSFEEICSKLMTEFKIPEIQCLEEVSPFVEEMVKEQIILIK